MKIETSFELWDKVRIYPLDKCDGRIVGFLQVPDTLYNKVRYFSDGKLYEEYFLTDELQAVNP